MTDVPVAAYDAAVAAIRTAECGCLDRDPYASGCPACGARAALAAAAPFLRAQGAQAERDRWGEQAGGRPRTEVVEGLFRLLETAERRVDEYGRALVALADLLQREHARRCPGRADCSVCRVLTLLQPATGADTDVRMTVVRLADGVT